MQRIAPFEVAVPFPLPLVPFEYYYWSDDRPDYPMVFVIELLFSGRLNRERFAAALQQALARHPMLSALIDESAGEGPVWVAAGDERPAVDWADEGVPIDDRDGEGIDLRTNVGLRLWVRRGDQATRVLLEFHHACCDGAGGVRFVEDLLICYSLATGGKCDGVQLRPLDPQRLKTRGDFGIALSTRTASMGELWRLARTWYDILLRQPVVLAAPGTNDQRPVTTARRLDFQTHGLDLAAVRNLRQVAMAHGATLNDLLLRDLFQVLNQWNRQHTAGRTNRRLRINMPTNLRSRDDARIPAANVLGFTFLTRNAGECADGRRLLASIRRETEAIKNQRLGLYHIGGLAFAARFKGLMPWVLGRNRCMATAVFSNMGKILGRTSLPRRGRRLVVGDVVLERITGVPPIRPLTRASFVATTYGEEMSISLWCDPAVFSVEQTRQLLAAYTRQLEKTIAGVK